MAISVLTGKLSHSDHSTEMTPDRGAASPARTAHSWAFRLNNRPAIFKQRQTASFADGDEVTAIGEEKNGTFMIYCCRNESTGATYESSGTIMLVLSIMVIALSIPLCFILIGIPLLAFGIWFLLMALKGTAANKLLRSTPPRAKA